MMILVSLVLSAFAEEPAAAQPSTPPASTAPAAVDCSTLTGEEKTKCEAAAKPDCSTLTGEEKAKCEGAAAPPKKGKKIARDDNNRMEAETTDE